MKKLNFFIFGYRDQYFWSSYGPIVRDLMICKTLADFDCVNHITFFNRPVSIYERILGRKTREMRKSLVDISKKIEFVDSTSFDILGPLSKRLWCENIYKNIYMTPPQLDSKHINIVIDFLPIGNLPNWTQDLDYIWYDLIDNFQKHNRYTQNEKKAVTEKYSQVKKLAHEKTLVTGVSSDAINEFENSLVLNNGILDEHNKTCSVSSSEHYDFGFMGFITDKFDIEKIEILAKLGYTIAIYGEFYDSSLKSTIEKIVNVTVFGRFSHLDTQKILSTFKIGLIPYIVEKLHDESPLKMFQYFSAQKLVLSCFDFNQKNSLLWVYSEENFAFKAKEAVSIVNSAEFHSLCALSSKNYYWGDRLNELFEAVKHKCL